MKPFNKEQYRPSSEAQRGIVQAVRNMQRQIMWLDRQRVMREAQKAQ